MDISQLKPQKHQLDKFQITEMFTFIAWGILLVAILILSPFVKVWDCLWGAGRVVCRGVTEVVASIKPEVEDTTEETCDAREKERVTKSSGDSEKVD